MSLLAQTDCLCIHPHACSYSKSYSYAEVGAHSKWCLHLVGNGWHSRKVLCKDRAVFWDCSRSSWGPGLCLWVYSSSCLWVYSCCSRWLLHCLLHHVKATNPTTMALLNRWPQPQPGPLCSFPSSGLQENTCSMSMTSCSCTLCCTNHTSAMPFGMQQGTHHELPMRWSARHVHRVSSIIRAVALPQQLCSAKACIVLCTCMVLPG